jgi:multicomponent Na+:H+ antiporter subunit C
VSAVVVYVAAGIGLIGAGTFGICSAADGLRRIIAINVAAVGVLTVMVALAARGDGVPDPVTHAMVLTGLVVSASATALALALARRRERLNEPGQSDEHRD